MAVDEIWIGLHIIQVFLYVYIVYLLIILKVIENRVIK